VITDHVNTEYHISLEIRNLLVHPKDKVSKEDTAECVYKIPCKNCQKVYIREKRDVVLKFV